MMSETDVIRKYPIGIQTFRDIIESGRYYVDKTDLIWEIVSRYKYVFLSRPRRFGKSLLISTFASYFRAEKELFKGLAVDSLEKEWTQYPVIHLSLASVKEMEPAQVRSKIDFILDSQYNLHVVDKIKGDLGSRFSHLIYQCFIKYGQRVVVMLDEYDAPLLNVIHNEEVLPQVRQLMRTLYSPLKDCDPYLRFVFITGISKFSQLSIFSEINNLFNISLMPEYSTLCGFTQQEVEHYFSVGIRQLAEKEQLNEREALRKLKETYDGYHFAPESPGVYNPFSILTALSKRRIQNYWFATGTPTFLVEMLRKFHTDISDIDGSRAEETEFDAPTEDMKSVLPLFYQSGYITIKDYERQSEIFQLGFPNKEVRTGLMNTLYPNYVTPQLKGKADNIWKICKGFMDGDPEQSLEVLQAYLEGIPYQDSHFDENHYTQMLYVIFSLLGVHVQSQVRTAKGRIDAVVSTTNKIYVIEVKLDHPAQEAIDQIDRKGYLIPYTLDSRHLTKIGLSFSTQTRTITEWKMEEV